jgi:hypothetical protein
MNMSSGEVKICSAQVVVGLEWEGSLQGSSPLLSETRLCSVQAFS